MLFLLPQEETFSRLDLVGDDAVDFAQRLFSRDFKKINLAEPQLTLILTPDGKVNSFFWAVKREKALEIIIDKSRLQPLKELIDYYHFSDKFEIQEGPELSVLWTPLDESSSIPTSEDASFLSGEFRGTKFYFCEKEPPSRPVEKSMEDHRIDALIPRYAKDFDETTLVFDVGFEAYCDVKGCFIGQEVVERVRSRGGKSARSLSLIQWTDSVPKNADIVTADGKPAGKTTASLSSTHRGLAYIRRKVLQEKSPLQIKDTSITGEILKSVGD